MTLDPRLHAYRSDLADITLQGRVEAQAFVTGTLYVVTAPVTPLRQTPRPVASIDTELLYGEEVAVFEVLNGWAWCQACRDGYVGYTPISALEKRVSPSETTIASTHVIRAQRATVHPGPDLKSPPMKTLSFGSCLSVSQLADGYAALTSGEFIHETAIRPINQVEADPVEVALKFLHTPYLWGGRSGFGIDCSGLVQLSWQACGIDVPRDTDMQVSSFGTPVSFKGDQSILLRGDLVFWRGHVGIWISEREFLHANAADMSTEIEPLKIVADRIQQRGYGEIIQIRRPPPLSAHHAG